MKTELKEQIAVALDVRPPYLDNAVEKEARQARTLTLNNSEMWKVGRYLGRNIETADDLLSAAKNVTTLRVKGLDDGEIVLEPYVLDRLRSRCHPTTDFPDFVREVVVKCLMDYCGC